MCVGSNYISFYFEAITFVSEYMCASRVVAHASQKLKCKILF